jgi:hypothetical protein
MRISTVEKNRSTYQQDVDWSIRSRGLEREKKYGREKQGYVPARQKTGVLEVLVVVREKKYGREKQEYVPTRQ